jgi:hypothetical protein
MWGALRNSAEGFYLRVQRTVAGVFHHISPEQTSISTKSAFAGRSASSKARSSGEPGAAGRGYKLSGHECRRRFSCRRSSEPPSGERCAAPASAESPSSPPVFG